MNKNQENQFDFSNWYDFWMSQSKEFFENTDKYLKDLFIQPSTTNPEDHMQQINAWLDALKNHWQFIKLTEEQQAYEKYINSISMMCIEAGNMMVKKWINRYKENRPIKNQHELYELWLECCREVYESIAREKSYQEMYSDFMNATIQYWKSLISK